MKKASKDHKKEINTVKKTERVQKGSKEIPKDMKKIE